MFFFESQVKFSVIKSFNEVKFDDNYKPLVICDIDHTFIRGSYELDDFRKSLNYYANLFLPKTDTDSFDVDKEAINLMNNSYNMGFVKQTDSDGFNNMLQRIEQLGGKLIFLTARRIINHEKTVKDLKRVGLEHPELFDIHYTNNEMTKGEYLKKTNLTDGYDHISFIDDYTIFIASVHHYFPQINCYLFKYD